MFHASIDVGSLCVVVVVVVCSWGLSLLLSLTCWNSYKKSRPNHLYCTQCSSLQYPPMPPMLPLQYQYPSYALPPPQPYHHYQALPHTAERLGILESGEQPAMLAPVLQSSHTSYTRGGGGLGVLETVHIPSPAREEDLDQDTTISRSFRSGAKRTSSSTNMRSLSRDGTHRSGNKEPRLTLNQRFASLSKSALPPQDANMSARSDTSAQSKLSQVRILTSPVPTEQGNLPALTITPGNAMRSTRKSLLSNISKRSVRSLLRRKSTKTRTLDPHHGSNNVGGARSKVLIPSATKDIEQGALTSETNLETSDEEVFTSQKPRTDPELVQYQTSPVNPKLSRQFPQEILLHKPHLVTQSRGSSGGSDWSNPRKDRQVGSPGNTANADYFTKQHTPQLLEIDLDRPPREQPRTEFVPRPDKQSRRRATSSAPPRQLQTRQDGGGTDQFQFSRGDQGAAQNNLLDVRPRKAYKPGYSESDFTSQSEDETRRHNWEGRGALDLPAGNPSPGSGFDLTPPTLDLSQVVPYEASAPTSSAVPLLTTSALSTNPSPLQYSSVSFSQSDMSLVVSPARPPTPTLPQYASSQSSHPISLDWDNYASDPQFQQDALGNLI